MDGKRTILALGISGGFGFGFLAGYFAEQIIEKPKANFTLQMTSKSLETRLPFRPTELLGPCSVQPRGLTN